MDDLWLAGFTNRFMVTEKSALTAIIRQRDKVVPKGRIITILLRNYFGTSYDDTASR